MEMTLRSTARGDDHFSEKTWVSLEMDVPQSLQTDALDENDQLT